jgi:hypothetical protein
MSDHAVTIRTTMSAEDEGLSELRLRRYRLLRQSHLGPAWVLLRRRSDVWVGA